jgi:peptidyl-Lys metalloendopeptidase
VLKKLWCSLFLLVSNSCFAYNFQFCSQQQSEQIIVAAEQATKYTELVIEHNDPAPFIKWLGYNEMYDIKRTYALINNALRDQQIDFSCYCNNDSLWARSVVNAKTPQGNYMIDICPKFWKAPLHGFDSRSGTLIHELSHMSDIRGTRDNLKETKECLNAAKTKEGQSVIIENADSYEFLAEDIFSGQLPS